MPVRRLHAVGRIRECSVEFGKVNGMDEEVMELNDEDLKEISGGALLNHEQMMQFRRLQRAYRIAFGKGDAEAAAAAKQKMDDYLKSL